MVIPTLNGGALFEEVLEKIRAQRFDGDVEVVVIDSGSTDQTVGAAKKAGARVVEIVPGEFDHGLTRNRGIEESSGEIVVLMTQDAVPADDQLLESLVAAFEDPLVAGAFARQVPRPEHDVLIARGIHAWVAGQADRRVSQITSRSSYDALAPIHKYLFCVFDNVCSAVRRSAWRKTPFRQNAFGEDLDWSKRVLEEGWKIVYEPRAAVVHSHDRSVRYEYKRTYMCHRVLYRLFGVETIPARKYVARCWTGGVWGDLRYVGRHQSGVWRKLRLMARVPFLVYASVMGQYRGARDERLGRGKQQTGV